MADINMLKVILRNLLSNAVKSSGYKAMVFFSAAETGGGVVVTFQDTGIRMSREILENLFCLDVYTRRHGTAREPGDGLGLQLAREYTALLGGTMDIGSEEEKRTTVWVGLRRAGYSEGAEKRWLIYCSTVFQKVRKSESRKVRKSECIDQCFPRFRGSDVPMFRCSEVPTFRRSDFPTYFIYRLPYSWYLPVLAQRYL